jgi:hypothetical protein
MRLFGLARVLAVLASAGLLPATAWACPFCNSSTAQRVREGIFNADFTYNLGVTVAPFVVLFAALILIHCWPTSRRAVAPGLPKETGRSLRGG